MFNLSEAEEIPVIVKKTSESTGEEQEVRGNKESTPIVIKEPIEEEEDVEKKPVGILIFEVFPLLKVLFPRIYMFLSILFSGIVKRTTTYVEKKRKVRYRITKIDKTPQGWEIFEYEG